jgi:Xaa-Pro aminopeptidase
MPLKRSFAELEKALRRLSGLRYIHPDLNLGNGLSVQNITEMVETLKAKLEAHNAMVDALAKSREEIDTMEDALSKISERMLNTIAAIYGKDSNEYEIVGGKRRGSQTTATAANPDSADLQFLVLTPPALADDGSQPEVKPAQN